jgi:hypothetical protein
MEILIGSILAAVIALLARKIGFDNDKSFYPVLLIIIATYYILFAIQIGDEKAVLLEIIYAICFIIIAIIAYFKSLWLVVLMLFLHGIYDYIIPHSGAPFWWRGFCLSVDFVFAGFLFFKLFFRRS